MAKIIDRYSAEAGGSSTMYYYRYPDNSSEATRIYTGETIYLAADYGTSMEGSMYRLIDPEGWIHWYHVRNIQPVYKTVTDPCTAPDAVAIQNGVLTISGGSGGDLNAWTGFGVSHRQRAVNSALWGAWSEDDAVAERSIPVGAESGTVRQYRVRTLGSAGSSYFSGYTVCETLISGNTAAGTPVILLPVSGTSTCSGVCAVKLQCPPEPDGDSMTLQRSLDGSAWVNVKTLDGAGGTVYDMLSPETGEHTLRYRLVDMNGESGGEDGISFERAELNWNRMIEPNGIIANREISFVRDIHQLTECVNLLCAFYGRPALVLPGTPGAVSDWHRQLLAMQEAVDGCRAAAGRTAYGFERPEGWPSAFRINQLKQAIENT